MSARYALRASLVSKSFRAHTSWNADLLGLPYYPYFRLQLDAQFIDDSLADEFDQLQGLLGRTAPEVYEVVGVNRGDLDPAHTRAFQAGRLYHAAREVSLGALEGGAAARPVRRAVHTLRPKLFYAGLQFLRVAWGERVAGPQDDPARVLVQDAVAVGEVQFRVLHPDYTVVPEHVGPVEDLGRLAAVGAGVHVDRAADRAGDPRCELQAREAAARRGVGEHGVEYPGVGGHAPPFDLDVHQGFGEPDRESPDAAVPYEHVRTPAEDRDGDVVCGGLFGGRDQLVYATRFEEGVSGTPDLPGRVALQGFVELGRREEPV